MPDRQNTFHPLRSVEQPALAPVRTVAVVWEHQASVDRLDDVVPDILEQDRRVECVYVRAEGSSNFEESIERHVREFDGKIMSWDRATDPARRFDLVLAANSGYDSKLERLPGPVLRLSHGVGFNKLQRPGPGHGPGLADPPVKGAVPSTLVRHGRVVPAAIGVSHVHQREVLRAAIPEAEGVTHVVGDPAYDRALADRPRRRELRRAMGVHQGQQLVLVSSTWGSDSLFWRNQELLDRAVSELSPDHAVVAVLHPGVWLRYSPRQIRNWYESARRRGLRILDPASPWLGACLGADVVIGDHGSVTYYAASLGAAVLMAGGDQQNILAGSQVDDLHRRAVHYRPDLPLGPQVERVSAAHRAADVDRCASLLTSEPGRSHALLRSLVHDLLELPEPETPVLPRQLPVPRFLRDGGSACAA